MSAVICFENVRFGAFLKADKVPQHLIPMGNAFHRRGPTTRNDRSPKLANFVRGMWSNCCSDERVRPGLCLFSRFARYRGAIPFRYRYTWRNILNSMRHRDVCPLTPTRSHISGFVSCSCVTIYLSIKRRHWHSQDLHTHFEREWPAPFLSQNLSK